MPILKPSEETRKKLAGWLIFSPPGSRQSTSHTPQNSDSPEKPTPASPEPSVGWRDPLIENTCQFFKDSSISGGAGVTFARSIDPFVEPGLGLTRFRLDSLPLSLVIGIS